MKSEIIATEVLIISNYLKLFQILNIILKN